MFHKMNTRVQVTQNSASFGIDNKEVTPGKFGGLSLFGTRSRISAICIRSNDN